MAGRARKNTEIILDLLFFTVYFQKVFGLFSFYRLYFQNNCLIWQ